MLFELKRLYSVEGDVKMVMNCEHWKETVIAYFKVLIWNSSGRSVWVPITNGYKAFGLTILLTVYKNS